MTMIPNATLLRLLHNVLNVDDLRQHPDRLFTMDGGPSWQYFGGLDPEDKATVARIAAGEAWQGQ